MTTPADPIDRAVDLARTLIRFDTTNYGEGRSSGEQEAADWTAEFVRDLGLEPIVVDTAPRRRNVIARIPGREPDLGALLLHGHLDVVPAIAEDWSVDPFEGLIRDGMLWGRGAVDMKNVDAMMLAAVEELITAGERPRREIILTFFADEENGGVFGSMQLTRERPELFAGAEYAISEVGGYSVDIAGRNAYLVQTAEKALVWVTLTAEGRAGHGSTLGRENAIVRLADAISRIGAHEWPLAGSPTVQVLLERVAELSGRPLDPAHPEALLTSCGAAADYLTASLRTTANPTGLTAGYKHNVIPGSASATIDIRCVAGDEDAVLATLRELAGEHVRVDVVTQGPGIENAAGSPLLDTIAAVIDEHDPGAVAVPYTLPAGTDNKWLAQLGIIGYGFAPLKLPADFDFMSMFHGVDERVPVDAIAFGRRVYADLLRRA